MRAIRLNFVVAAVLLSAASSRPVAAATEQVLYQFDHAGSGYPQAPLLVSKGKLMGEATAYLGHRKKYGDVFELLPSNGSWSDHTILRFDGANGSNPFGGLTEDSNGVFYGTTFLGGTYGEGTLFRLARTARGWGQKTYSFGSDSDGREPESNLITDGSGALYGTTQLGGLHGNGTAFKLSYSRGSWSETILHSFAGSDGAAPVAGLLRIGKEMFVGMTFYGGNAGSCGGTSGCGTVFQISRSQGGWTETVLHNFADSNSDGGEPSGGLVKDAAGSLYGTTQEGGPFNNNCFDGSCGTVFELTQSGGVWTEKVIYSFSGPDGGVPLAGVLLDGSGALYGTTWEGGTHNGGTVFKLTQSGGVWSEEVIYSFAGGSGGYQPNAAVIADENGNLYGTTSFGGDTASCGYRGCGVVYEITR
jgi:uncharacterized repeat protein (TIGR03803 family)